MSATTKKKNLDDNFGPWWTLTERIRRRKAAKLGAKKGQKRQKPSSEDDCSRAQSPYYRSDVNNCGCNHVAWPPCGCLKLPGTDIPASDAMPKEWIAECRKMHNLDTPTGKTKKTISPSGKIKEKKIPKEKRPKKREPTSITAKATHDVPGIFDGMDGVYNVSLKKAKAYAVRMFNRRIAPNEGDGINYPHVIVYRARLKAKDSYYGVSDKGPGSEVWSTFEAPYATSGTGIVNGACVNLTNDKHCARTI